MLLKIDDIRIDGGTQPRAEISESTIADYAESMRMGSKIPPVVVYFDGSSYWLADGFHRYHARRRNEDSEIDADVVNGTKRDAILYSVGANHDHGLPRSNADKRRAVQTLLADSEWAKWSDREIAKRCRVSFQLVSNLRPSLPTVGSENPEPRTYTTKHGTQATMKTDNIGKARQATECSSGDYGCRERTKEPIDDPREHRMREVKLTYKRDSPHLAAAKSDWLRMDRYDRDAFLEWLKSPEAT